MSVYNLNDTAIFLTGRTTSYTNNGAKHRMLTRNSCMEFDTSGTAVAILVAAADPTNAYRVYLNDVDQGVVAPTGTAGEDHTQTITIVGLTGGGTWTNIRVMVTAGNEGFSGFLDTATITTTAGSIRFKGGTSPVNMVRELVGGTNGQAKGLYNAPLPNGTASDNSKGNISPFCVGNNWQVVGERRAKANKIGVLMSSGGGAVGLYKDGVFQTEVILTGSGTDGGGLTRWRLVVFSTSL